MCNRTSENVLLIVSKLSLCCIVGALITAQKSHYPPSNHHANHQYWMTWHLAYRPSTSKGDNWSEGSSAPVASRWLWPINRTCLEVASMVVTWWKMAFWCGAYHAINRIWLCVRDLFKQGKPLHNIAFQITLCTTASRTDDTHSVINTMWQFGDFQRVPDGSVPRDMFMIWRSWVRTPVCMG